MGLSNKAYFWVTLEEPQWVDSCGVAVAFELGTEHKEGHTEDPPLEETDNQCQQALYPENEQHLHLNTSTSSADKVLLGWSPHKIR